MKITALAPWFGSNRTLAANVGAALKGRKWVGVPFAGGMSELVHIDARTVLVCDKHEHLINLATVLKHHTTGPELIRKLRRAIFHRHELEKAQQLCRAVETGDVQRLDSVAWAEAYFICAWMARNGEAGTEREFRAGFSVRWDAGGGDSATRFRNATESLREWRSVMQRCTFDVMDVFEFLSKCNDDAECGFYLDPPFPEVGDKYKFRFDVDDHRDLAERLMKFKHCRVVCRFYDHPLIRELYPESAWTWHHFEGRRQTNTVGPEVLLVRNGA